MQSGVLKSRSGRTCRGKNLSGFFEKPPEYCIVERNSIYCQPAFWALLTVLCGCSSSRREDLASSPFLPPVKILLHPDVYSRILYHILTHHPASAAYVLLWIMEFSWLPFHVWIRSTRFSAFLEQFQHL